MFEKPLAEKVKKLAADRLKGRPEAKIVDALIETSRHADDRVRQQALRILGNVTQMTGNAEARAVLESVLENEPELATELRLAEILARQQSRTVPR